MKNIAGNQVMSIHQHSATFSSYRPSSIYHWREIQLSNICFIPLSQKVWTWSGILLMACFMGVKNMVLCLQGAFHFVLAIFL